MGLGLGVVEFFVGEWREDMGWVRVGCFFGFGNWWELFNGFLVVFSLF